MLFRSIRAQRSAHTEQDVQWLAKERPVGTYARQLTVGRGLALDKISATYTDGVLTLTIPVINSAARVAVLATGAEKASAVGLALAGASPDEVPLAAIRARRRTGIHVDRAAAAQVPPRLIDPGEFWTSADN